MPKADQFAVGLALITTSLAALLSVHSLAYGALFLGLYLICNPFIQDYFWGEYRPSTDQISKMSATEYQQKLNTKFDRWVKHISKPHPIKWELLIPTLLVLVVVGVAGFVSNSTRKPSGQWVLESYSADRGFTFEKDGVHYRTHCAGFMSSEPIEGLPKGAVVRPMLSSTQSENACSAVLPHIHQVVPLKQGNPFTQDVLIYPQASDGGLKNGAFEFLIVEANSN